MEEHPTGLKRSRTEDEAANPNASNTQSDGDVLEKTYDKRVKQNSVTLMTPNQEELQSLMIPQSPSSTPSSTEQEIDLVAPNIPEDLRAFCKSPPRGRQNLQTPPNTANNQTANAPYDCFAGGPQWEPLESEYPGCPLCELHRGVSRVVRRQVRWNNPNGNAGRMYYTCLSHNGRNGWFLTFESDWLRDKCLPAGIGNGDGYFMYKMVEKCPDSISVYVEASYGYIESRKRKATEH
ncbi:hypothetical protein HYFRA_00011326 [Hymenoscyphus fraxineus]|uniref:GRF-like zinc ribbon domain-containing protein n=1 Tax=Hymenoscyphus fraxineus TaxID=746836 RepID=A0A9N9PV87_9HELO|nr:hypothetical protein HYFRA_00011326 [Hymenoscyphus fraxineus]